MTIDRSGASWIGTSPADIDEYLTAFTSDGYPATRVIHASCSTCQGTAFRILVDDEEGCAERICVTCKDQRLLIDSGDTVDGAELEGAECPCGGEIFNAAVGFALRDDGEVRWVHLGLRCIDDGVLGVYTDWKVDYSPTAHLFENV
jgi:hypothetical protein